MNWAELETSTYQHHVIKHVVGATILGWFIARDAVHFVLDVGLLWTIYVNAEMNLMALFVAIEDLESEGFSLAKIEELISDAQSLISFGRDARGLMHFKAASVDCLVEQVHVFSEDSQRRIVIAAEAATIEVHTSISDSSVTVFESHHADAR